MKVLTKKSITYLIILAVIGISVDSFCGGGFDEQDKKTKTHVSKTKYYGFRSPNDPTTPLSAINLEEELCKMIQAQREYRILSSETMIFDQHLFELTKIIIIADANTASSGKN